jgi:hypothetical protein
MMISLLVMLGERGVSVCRILPILVPRGSANKGATAQQRVAFKGWLRLELDEVFSGK